MALLEPPPPPRLRRNGRLRGMELAELLGVIIEMKILKNYKNFEELLGNELTSHEILTWWCGSSWAPGRAGGSAFVCSTWAEENGCLKKEYERLGGETKEGLERPPS